MDINALLNVIHSANKFICIAVMDYIPAVIYSNPKTYELYFSARDAALHVTFIFCRFWPVIDDALKSVAYNKGIKVRVMGSIWDYTEPDMIKFLKSLQNANGTGQYNGTLEVVSCTINSLCS